MLGNFDFSNIENKINKSNNLLHERLENILKRTKKLLNEMDIKPGIPLNGQAPNDAYSGVKYNVILVDYDYDRGQDVCSFEIIPSQKTSGYTIEKLPEGVRVKTATKEGFSFNWGLFNYNFLFEQYSD